MLLVDFVVGEFVSVLQKVVHCRHHLKVKSSLVKIRSVDSYMNKILLNCNKFS
jgi:hypothetical protein